MATENINPNVIDINLSATKKKKFRIDGDDSRIVELNTSDARIVGRLSEAYPKLQELNERAGQITAGLDTDGETDDELKSAKIMGERLAAVDKEMRELIDYLFDANVSEIVAPDGSMYDPFNGSFRFEYIIEAFIAQYQDNLQAEYNKMTKQVEKHTKKYTKKK